MKALGTQGPGDPRAAPDGAFGAGRMTLAGRAQRAQWQAAVAAMAATLTALALTLSACGGSHAKPSSGPGAAEPAAAPAAHVRPPGRAVSVGAVGSSPEGIVVDRRSGLAVVAVRNPSALVLLNPRSERVVGRVRTAAPARHLQIAGAGGEVLVPEEAANTLLELSLPDAHVRSIAVGAHPHDATEADGKVFVSDEFGRAVSLVEGGRVVATVDGFLQPGGIAAAGSRVAVVDVRGNSLTLLDARDGRKLGRLSAGAGPTHAVSEGTRVFVIDTRGGAILSYRTQPGFAQIGRLVLPGAPYGVAIDPSRHRLWVTLTAENRLVELDTYGRSARIVAEYRTGRQPNTVAVDQLSGRVLVADAGEATVQVLKPVR